MSREIKKTRKWSQPYTIELADVADTSTEHDRKERVPARTLAVEALTVRYGTVVAVNDVSFRLEPGRVTGLIGPNGAGKTSLIDAISGFAPSQGKVLLDDVDLSKRPAMRRARAGVARSFQSLELFEDSTVFENLSVAADPQDLRSYFLDLIWPVNPPLPPEVVRAITEFDLDQDLHRDVQDLSYGKRRLLAIARAVAMHPSVLLLDEPAAGLSSSESAELARVVRRLADDWGMAILVVEHDMNFVMGVCDQVIVLDFGKLIAAGSPEHVRNDPAVIAAYLGDETDEQLEAESLDASSSGIGRSGIGRGRCVMRAPLLETRNLKAGYLGREVVRAVNLTVQPGEVVCLLGPNGAGKSTTLLTIAGELAPVDGIVHVQQRADLHADGQAGPRRWHRPDHRGTAGVHEDVGPRQPAPRRWFGRRRAGAVPRAGTAAVGAGRDAVGRRAADVGARPRAEP